MVTSEGVTPLRLAFGRACPHNGNWETIWHLRSSRLRRPPRKFLRSLVVRHFHEAKQRHNFRKNVARRRQLRGGQFFGWRRRLLLERWAMKNQTAVRMFCLNVAGAVEAGCWLVRFENGGILESLRDRDLSENNFHWRESVVGANLWQMTCSCFCAWWNGEREVWIRLAEVRFCCARSNGWHLIGINWPRFAW